MFVVRHIPHDRGGISLIMPAGRPHDCTNHPLPVAKQVGDNLYLYCTVSPEEARELLPLLQRFAKEGRL